MCLVPGPGNAAPEECGQGEKCGDNPATDEKNENKSGELSTGMRRNSFLLIVCVPLFQILKIKIRDVGAAHVTNFPQPQNRLRQINQRSDLDSGH